MKVTSFLKTKKPGYALIYTLIFIVLLLITVSVTWVTGMLDIRMARQSEYSAVAYQMAETAIESGWTYYKNTIDSTYDSVNTVPPVTYPANACGSTSVIVRVNPNVIPVTSPSANLAPGPSTVLTAGGSYDYRICTTAGVTTIEGIGYYKGNKITLKANVVHGADSGVCSPVGGTFPNCTPGIPIMNHPKDYITIYQTGPSS